ncbi:MAG: hypothetical protein AOA65_0663 [Candidatus Bathyarchaeota archaeon BA1]|nr:MAG: hypothetical protein AOA65_0663 [Candidatus Bathyarchaeota archaeon BA1]
MEINEKETRILLELYNVGGAARWSELKEKLIDTGVMSEATLYLKLKDLKERKEGLVQRLLINDEIRWVLTTKGVHVALRTWASKGIPIPDETLKELQSWSESFYLTIKPEQFYSEAVQDFISYSAEKIEPEHIVLRQTKEEFEGTLKMYHAHIKDVAPYILPNLFLQTIILAGSVSGLSVLARTFLPTPLQEKNMEELKEFINSAIDAQAKLWLEKFKRSMLRYFMYLETFVVRERAIKEQKLAPTTREMPPDELIQKLTELELLPAIKEDSP